MANKYYLDEVGLARLLDKLSQSIENHTTNEIQFDEVIDSQSGETVKVVIDPDNFITTQSIIDYLEDNISVSQDVSSSTANGYDVNTNEIDFDGAEGVHLDLALITSGDIDDLFNPVNPPELEPNL